MPWVEPIARRAAWVTIAAAIVAFFYFASPFVIPLALAILFAFALSPVAGWIEHRIHSRLISVLIASTIGLGVVALLVGIFFNQATDFASRLSDYRHSIAEKVIAIRGTGQGLLGKATEAVGDIKEEVEKADTKSKPLMLPPIRVVSADDEGEFASTAISYAGHFIEPVVQMAVVVVLTVLLLLFSEDVRDRFVVLAGTQQLSLTTQALQEASRRVGRYLLALSCVNLFFGSAIAAGLYFIGVENALLLGLIAGMLRFVPLLGAWLGALLPAAVGMAVFNGWHEVIMIGILFVALEALTNFVLEPFIYGHSTGVSGTAVIVAILFWTWIWGPVGLLLAVPVTVCLVVFGKYVEPLRVFYILLSDEPVLSGDRRLYHRLVTDDAEDAEQIITDALTKSDAAITADTLLLPVLRDARADAARGVLTDDRLRLLNDTMTGMVAEHAPFAAEGTPAGVACVAVEPLDRTAAAVTASALTRSTGSTIALIESSISSELITAAKTLGASALILVTTSGESLGRARLLAKVLQSRSTGIRVIVADLGQVATAATNAVRGRFATFSSVEKLAVEVQQLGREKVGVDQEAVVQLPTTIVNATTAPA